MSRAKTLPSPDDSDRLIGVAALEQMLDTHRSTLWRGYKQGSFPKPIYVGHRRAWWLSEIRAWIDQRSGEAPSMARANQGRDGGGT
jgi:predicted DNA-binding transcriptional regulator AlpA